MPTLVRSRPSSSGRDTPAVRVGDAFVLEGQWLAVMSYPVRQKYG
jgi:hypothetical protein